VDEGESSRDYAERRPIQDLLLTGDLAHLYYDNNGAHLYYDRPLYFSTRYNHGIVNTGTVYAGRRWFVTVFETEEGGHQGSVYSNLPHAYWDNIVTRHARFYSDPTNSYIPTGLKWNEIEFPRSTGDFGIFGASFPVKGRYECIHVDCMNDIDVCGRYGNCVTRTEVVNGAEAPYNQCECANYTGGYFCEHHPDQPYSRDMYNEYIENPASYRKHNPNVEYLKFWVNETVKADVGVMGQEEDQDKTAQYDDGEL